ncbi:hypothetical protein AnaeK_0382 [Anaeromyxobacter sp. K]|nr:hypothetical protein AnaeK_0382 [Anaeromyxobacter sp. K]
MRVVHFQRTSDTGHVVPWCGVWGSTDTDWTTAWPGVTCVACRDAMRAGLRGGEPSTRGSGSARSQAPGGRSSFALRYAVIALLTWMGAWALRAAGGVLLPPAGSRAAAVALGITVGTLALGGAALAALAGMELALGPHRRGARVRG